MPGIECRALSNGGNMKEAVEGRGIPQAPGCAHPHRSQRQNRCLGLQHCAVNRNQRAARGVAARGKVSPEIGEESVRPVGSGHCGPGRRTCRDATERLSEVFAVVRLFSLGCGLRCVRFRRDVHSKHPKPQARTHHEPYTVLVTRRHRAGKCTTYRTNSPALPAWAGQAGSNGFSQAGTGHLGHTDSAPVQFRQKTMRQQDMQAASTVPLRHGAVADGRRA